MQNSGLSIKRDVNSSTLGEFARLLSEDRRSELDVEDEHVDGSSSSSLCSINPCCVELDSVYML